MKTNKFILKHDLKNSKKELIICSAVLAGFILLFMLLFLMIESMQEAAPGETQSQMALLSDPVWYFATQVGTTITSILLFYACSNAVTAWAKDEKENTAELILQLPVSRETIWASRLKSLTIKMLIYNAVAWVMSALSITLIGLLTGNWSTSKNILAIVLFFVGALALSLIVAYLVFFLSIKSKKIFTVKTGILIGVFLYLAGVLIDIFLSDLVLTARWQEILAFLSLFSITRFSSASLFMGAMGTGGQITYEFWWAIGTMAVWSIAAILAVIYSLKFFKKRDLKN